LDLLAVQLPDKLLYPAVAVDAVYSGAIVSTYGSTLRKTMERRGQLAAIASESNPKDEKRKAQAGALLAELDSLSTALLTPDATTKLPMLMLIMRGEIGDAYVSQAGGRVLTVRIAAKGGSSLKTSSIWRSDRLYAAGGVIATYRLTGGNNNPRVLKAGAVTAETGFVEVPLKP
jgi:hypothetical protein